MKITKVRREIIFRVDTDEDDFYLYTRLAKDDWQILAGEFDVTIISDEKINELEEQFQEYMSKNKRQDEVPDED